MGATLQMISLKLGRDFQRALKLSSNFAATQVLVVTSQRSRTDRNMQTELDHKGEDRALQVM